MFTTGEVEDPVAVTVEVRVVANPTAVTVVVAGLFAFEVFVDVIVEDTGTHPDRIKIMKNNNIKIVANFLLMPPPLKVPNFWWNNARYQKRSPRANMFQILLI